jgi:hypothetical protein
MTKGVKMGPINPVPEKGSRWIATDDRHGARTNHIIVVDGIAMSRKASTGKEELRIAYHSEATGRRSECWYATFRQPSSFAALPAAGVEPQVAIEIAAPKPTTIREWCAAAYAQSARSGFHDGDATTPEREQIASLTANMHSEASELWEAFRAGNLRKPCDKAERMAAMGLRPLTCLEEELADIALRNHDNARTLGVDLQEAMEIKHAYNGTRAPRHGGKLA